MRNLRRMNSFSDLIDVKGASAIAEAARAKLGTVRIWKHRNRIPRTAWPEISAAFPDLTTDALVAIEGRSESKAA